MHRTQAKLCEWNGTLTRMTEGRIPVRRKVLTKGFDFCLVNLTRFNITQVLEIGENLGSEIPDTLSWQHPHNRGTYIQGIQHPGMVCSESTDETVTPLDR